MTRTRILAAAAIAAAAVPTAAIATAGERPTGLAATTVSVSGKEYSFKLSRKSAPHGSIRFAFTNKGRLKHDFKIAGKSTRVLKKGKSQTITVRLSKGTYKYVCTVKGHAAAGMKGTFRAT
jgi:plastocyanin